MATPPHTSLASVAIPACDASAYDAASCDAPFCDVSHDEQAQLVLLQRSGLFDGAWFAARNFDFTDASHAALLHWFRFGWREHRWPNAYFDPEFYRANSPDAGDGNPLLHYIEHGEAAGDRPVPFFDPAWYRRQHIIPAGELALTHFLRHRFSGEASPIPEFDSDYYLTTNPDVRAAAMDPLEHYLLRGFSEGRLPSQNFNRRRQRNRPDPDGDPNPLLELLARQRLGTAAMAEPSSIAHEVRRNTLPHPGFEAVTPLPPGIVPHAKLLAYYLPQYHPVPENDQFWGRGFTEWTNLQRALPRFAGHYQPRIPGELGHYRLDQPGTLRRQVELARGAGLHGFVFYHYWFNGRRLLQGPIEALLGDPTIAFPFCLMWANENWTRRWDGSDDQVLMSQDYRAADEPALLAEFARCFADPRYIRLLGRPLLMIYRPRLIPDTAATIARWRARFRELHGEDPVFVMAQSFGDTDPRAFGMDAAVEFPPHKLTERLELINDQLDVLDPDFSAEVYDYNALADASINEPAPPYPLIKTAVPGWDNDPRRQGAGTVLHGATPNRYQAWLEQLVRNAAQHPVLGERLVCINAWNEWAEGAYLEPDVHYGAAFLNATARAVAGLPAPGSRTRLLLVGHDAREHGAQILLLHIGRVLRAAHGIDVGFLLLGDGVLLAQYQAIAPVQIARDHAELARHIADARAAGCTAALVNSAASARAVRVLEQHGVASVLLVHELPRIIREKGLQAGLREGVAAAQRVVFAAGFVRDHCHELVALDPAKTEILPQGLYKPSQQQTGPDIREELRVPDGAILAVGMGYADLRKGFDLFLQLWRSMPAGQPVHFAWAGGIDPAMANYLGGEIAAATAAGRFRCLGQRADTGRLLAAADVFVLTSREDPLPSVVLEALSAGVPVVAFDETGGTPELLAQMDAGESVPLGDVPAMASAVRRVAAGFNARRSAALAVAAAKAFSFDTYCARLLALARPELLRVSVVVPSYNYARFMPARLASIFAQSYPVHEVIVIDDASCDGSAAAADKTAAAWGRQVAVERRETNSGSVFAAWRRAAERATGEWLWIAEADDLCGPDFLGALAAAAGRARNPVMAFCDSAAIDEAGWTLWADHKAYYAETRPGALSENGVFEGPDFLRSYLAERNLILNVSAVLWRRADLLAALHRAEADLKQLRMAGDWRLYAELLCRPESQVAYVAAPLNQHRRHARSVTHSLSQPAHAAEIGRVHGVIQRLLGPDPALRSRQRSYRRSLATRPDLAKPTLLKPGVLLKPGPSRAKKSLLLPGNS